MATAFFKLNQESNNKTKKEKQSIFFLKLEQKLAQTNIHQVCFQYFFSVIKKKQHRENNAMRILLDLMHRKITLSKTHLLSSMKQTKILRINANNFVSKLTLIVKNHQKKSTFNSFSRLVLNFIQSVLMKNLNMKKKMGLYEQKIKEIQNNFQFVQTEIQNTEKEKHELSQSLLAMTTQKENLSKNVQSLQKQVEVLTLKNQNCETNLILNSKSLISLQDQLNSSLQFQELMKSAIIDLKAANKKLIKKLTRSETKLQETEFQHNEMFEQSKSNEKDLENRAKTIANLQKDVLALSENSKEKDNEIKRKDQEVFKLNNLLLSKTAEISKIKDEKNLNEEARIRSLQNKLDNVFNENEELKSELQKHKSFLQETQKSASSSKSQLSIENMDLKSTIAKMNKEKLVFFRELSLLNDKYQKLEHEKEESAKTLNTYQSKLEEYEHQLQKCKVIIEELTKTPRNVLFSQDHEVSFVSSKSNREKFSIKNANPEVIEDDDSHDDIMKKVNQIHEKYAKIKTDK